MPILSHLHSNSAWLFRRTVISQLRIPLILIMVCLVFVQNTQATPSLSLRQKASVSNQDVFLGSFQGILRNQTKLLLQDIKQDTDGSYWHYPMYLGLHLTSQLWLVSNWIGRVGSQWNLVHFQNLLLSSQRPDGSWSYLPDPNEIRGHLDATILNYWALKSMGFPMDHPALLNAKAFILEQGGAGRANKYTQIFLMAFGNQNWTDFPRMPPIPFVDLAEVVRPQVAAWVRPNIDPIIYLFQKNVVKNMGPLFHVPELYRRPQRVPLSVPIGHFQTLQKDLRHARKILYQQRLHGSWGGGTATTMFAQMALHHAATALPEKSEVFETAIQRGQEFNHRMTLESGDFAYLGVALDGRYWDTALIGQTLAELGVARDQLTPAAHFLLNSRDSSGGYGFGLDFEIDKDTDDTAEILLFYHRIQFSGPHIKESLQWLESMQNHDGGWGAFSKNNFGNWLLRTQTKHLEDTVDPFDESSPDIVGHILEALGAYSYRIDNSMAVRRAVEYLKKNQEASGAWYGRWGVNYLYGTSAAIIGLSQVGFDMTHPIALKADLWLKSCQNADGGFGESFGSYADPSRQCQGVSTPTQTAWALLALLETNAWYDQSVLRAAEYLRQTYNFEKGWTDSSINGTGLPVTLPMQYPVYPKAFPTLALQKFLRAMGQ